MILLKILSILIDERADFNHYLFEEVTLDNIKNSLASRGMQC